MNDKLVMLMHLARETQRPEKHEGHYLEKDMRQAFYANMNCSREDTFQGYLKALRQAGFLKRIHKCCWKDTGRVP